MDNTFDNFTADNGGAVGAGHAHDPADFDGYAGFTVADSTYHYRESAPARP